MKIRQGFVSNSSTSSFCIYGITLEEDWTEILKLIKKNSPEIFEKFKNNFLKDNNELGLDCDQIKDWFENIENQEYDIDGDIDNEDFSCILKNIINKETGNYSTKLSGFNIEIPCDCGTIYIGRSWNSIGNEETGVEFKKQIEERLKKIFGNEIECKTLELAWRDG